MIKQLTSRELIPESLLKKWETPKEQEKNLTYVEGVEVLVPENRAELQTMVDYLLRNKRRLIGFDTEATSTRPESASIVGMSFAVDDDRCYYVPIGHKAGTNIPLEVVAEVVAPVLQERLCMAGGKYDWHLLKRHGIDIRWGMDSQSMSRLLGEVDYGVGLKPTVARMFSERMIEFGDMVTKAKQNKGETFANVEIGLASLYAGPDAIYTRRVVRQAMEEMSPTIKTFLMKVEHEVMRIAGEMEYVGTPLDEKFLESKIEAGEAITKTLRLEAIDGLKSVAERRGKSREDIPDDLNLNSAQQMQKALFDVCGFKPVKSSKKTGKPSADKQSIEKMAERDPEVDWVRRFRSASSRVRDLRELYDNGIHEGGWFWIHASLTPTGTSTGRWSGSGPNLQNMPKFTHKFKSQRSEWSVAVREAVCAPPGWYIVTADYSQIELRVAAGESQCRMWLDAFANGDDVHSASGAAIHNVPIADVTKKQRADGKTFNFALLFGQEVKSTAQQLGVSVAEAQRMQNAFWSGLPEVKSWIDRIHITVRRQKFVETKFGRRRWLRGIDSDNKWTVLQNLRESVNTVVQGTAADVLKIGLLRQESVAEAMGAKLFLVVHDQYVWLVPERTAPDVFCREMDKVINFGIEGYPEMVSDYGIGRQFNSLVEFAVAADVPPTWDEVFARENNATNSGSIVSGSLHIEVEDLDTQQLVDLTKLVTDHPGSTEVIVSLTRRGLEKPMLDRTSLTIDDELRIKAVVGVAAKVSMV